MRNTLILIIYFFLFSDFAKADWMSLATQEVNGLEVSLFGATTLNQDANATLELKVFLKNVSMENLLVLTEFEHTTLLRTKSRISIPLIFANGKSITGEKTKRSLEGYGKVELKQGETTEGPSISVMLLDGEEFKEVISKLKLVYDVASDRNFVYRDLWQGRIEVSPQEQGEPE